MAVTASFAPSSGTLTVFGDALGNTITTSRTAAGDLLVNSGVPISGGAPTVTNTSLIQVFGLNDNDTITLDESSGALPKALLFGGAGNDVVTGGSGSDQLFGQSGNDVLFGKDGIDFLFGGTENDTLTGGDGDDQMFGEGGDDRMIWNPGDDSDLMEGGGGIDTAEVNGGGDSEVFTLTANGARVRLDRVDPAPFFLDIGTTEKLVLNAGDGDDTFSATGDLASLIAITVDGGAGNDTLLGSNGADTLLGGDGNDFVDGQQGNDHVFLGAGDDTFQWDPGDGNDVIEGQDGIDTFHFNGSTIGEILVLAGNGERALFTRNIANIALDMDGVEAVKLNALGGADAITINDLTATDIREVAIDLRSNGVPDGQADSVTAGGGDGGEAIELFGSGGTAQVAGLAALVQMQGVEGIDHVIVQGLGGNDTISATTVQAGAMLVTLDGGAGNDRLLGGRGDDTMIGGDGNDVLDGGAGADRLDGGIGNDTYVIDTSTDVVIEDFGAGTDAVRSFLNSFSLGANLENLTFVGTGNFTGLGNGFNNTIRGGAGADTFQGGEGNDKLFGGAGGDNLVGDDGLDTASYVGSVQAVKVALDGSVNAEGDALGDTFSSIENVEGTSFDDMLGGDAGNNRLTGGVGADTLLGGDGRDMLLGGAGNDVMTGGLGIDRMTGGEGDDRFDYASLAQRIDRIEDFSNVAGNDDVLRFESTFFGALPEGALDPSRFVANATGRAETLDQRFIYETDTGVLRFDSNGSANGGLVAIATLIGLPDLTAGDIVII